MKRQATIFAILALAAGYIFADAYEFAPGILTARPAEPTPRPYPQLVVASDTAGGSDAENVRPSETSTPDAAPIPDTEQVQAMLDAFATDRKRVVGNVSALVTDATTGKVLGSIDPGTVRTPASNMKVLTAFAALSGLGPDTKFDTTTRLDGTTVYLVGGGDILLGPPGQAKVGAYGVASIEELATETVKALQGKGATKVSLRVDSTLFSGPLRQQGAEANAQYVMEARPLGTKETGRTELFGSDPDLRVAQIFAEIARANGIEIETVARAEAPAPDTAIELAKVRSATVRSIVDYMLTYSDNSSAEALAHLLAIKRGKPADFVGASEAVREILEENGFRTDGMTLADGSGLSDQNRITAQILVDIHSRVVAEHGGDLGGLASGLPVGGYNGTLHGRFLDRGVGGLVRAKTGSLRDVRSLSGLLQTRSGRILVFAVIVDGIPEKVADEATGQETFAPDPKIAMDEMLAKIVAL